MIQVAKCEMCGARGITWNVERDGIRFDVCEECLGWLIKEDIDEGKEADVVEGNLPIGCGCLILVAMVASLWAMGFVLKSMIERAGI